MHNEAATTMPDPKERPEAPSSSSCCWLTTAVAPMARRDLVRLLSPTDRARLRRPRARSHSPVRRSLRIHHTQGRIDEPLENYTRPLVHSPTPPSQKCLKALKSSVATATMSSSATNHTKPTDRSIATPKCSSPSPCSVSTAASNSAVPARSSTDATSPCFLPNRIDVGRIRSCLVKNRGTRQTSHAHGHHHHGHQWGCEQNPYSRCSSSTSTCSSTSSNGKCSSRKGSDPRHRFLIHYSDEELHIRSQQKQQRLIELATSNQSSETPPSTSVLLARKALKYRKILTRLEKVDSSHPEFDVSEFLGVAWCKMQCPAEAAAASVVAPCQSSS